MNTEDIVWITVTELKNLYGISRCTIYRHVRAKHFNYKKVNTRILIDKDSFIKFSKDHTFEIGRPSKRKYRRVQNKPKLKESNTSAPEIPKLKFRWWNPFTWFSSI